jgi:hypothetical protein
MHRFLAIYLNSDGAPAATMVSSPTVGSLPFGFSDHLDRLPAFHSSDVILVEMPGDDFRPMVVDVTSDDEVAMSFVDLP